MHETFNEEQKDIWRSLKAMNTNLTRENTWALNQRCVVNFDQMEIVGEQKNALEKIENWNQKFKTFP
jgi:hypothetical protein